MESSLKECESAEWNIPRAQEALWKAFNLGVLDDNMTINMILIKHWKRASDAFTELPLCVEP